MMSMNAFPGPTGVNSDSYRESLTIIGFIFLGECILKVVAYRSNYFRDNWNLFDFLCVDSSVVIFPKIRGLNR